MRAVEVALAKAEPAPTELGERFAAAKRLFALQERLRRDIGPRAAAVAQVDCEDRIARLLGPGRYTEAQLEHVLAVYAEEARALPSDKLRHFNGKTNWNPDQVAIANSRELGAARAPPQASGPSKPHANHPVSTHLEDIA